MFSRPSLDWSNRPYLPGLSSWAKFKRSFGTRVEFSHTLYNSNRDYLYFDQEFGPHKLPYGQSTSSFLWFGMWRARSRLRAPLIHWLSTIVKFSNATVEGAVRLKVMEDLGAIDAIGACDFSVQCCRG